MRYWMWNADLSAEALKQTVLLDVLTRACADAAGPSCSLFAEVRQLERRLALSGEATDMAGDQRCPTISAGLPMRR